MRYQLKGLDKPVIKKCHKGKFYDRFKNSIWATDLAEMGLLSSFDCGVKYWLCVIDDLS